MKYRDGHSDYETVEEVLRTVDQCDYAFANFSGGRGFTDKKVGGLWGYVSDALYGEVVGGGYVFDMGSMGISITQKGHRVLGGCEEVGS